MSSPECELGVLFPSTTTNVCVSKDNTLTHIINGNFLHFMEKYSKNSIVGSSGKGVDLPDYGGYPFNVIHPPSYKGIVHRFLHKSSGGSKTGYIINNDIVALNYVIRNITYSTPDSPSDKGWTLYYRGLELYFHFFEYLKETLRQIQVYEKYPDLVSKIQTIEVIDMTKNTYLIQKVETNATKDNYHFVADYPSNDLVFQLNFMDNFDEIRDKISVKYLPDTHLTNLIEFYFPRVYSAAEQTDPFIVKTKRLTNVLFSASIFSSVLNFWWQLQSRLFLDNFFVYLNKLHKINVFHGDIGEQNILTKLSQPDNKYHFRFIDFGLSTSIDEWILTYETIPDSKKNSSDIVINSLFGLHREIYQYLTTDNNFQDIKNIMTSTSEKRFTKKMLYYLMLIELSPVNNIYYTSRFFSYLMFSYTIYPELFINFYETYTLTIPNPSQISQSIIEAHEQFVSIIINKVKIFIATKYSERIYIASRSSERPTPRMREPSQPQLILQRLQEMRQQQQQLQMQQQQQLQQQLHQQQLQMQLQMQPLIPISSPTMPPPAIRRPGLQRRN